MTTALEVCGLCGGQAQIAEGVACPVCQGAGMASPAAVTAYRDRMAQAATAGAVARARQLGAAGVDLDRRLAAQARQDALQHYQAAELAARRAEAALSRIRAQSAADQAARDAHAADMAALVPLALPAPQPGGPAIPVSGGTKEPTIYADSISARQLDVWGVVNFPGGGGFMPNPMTTTGDMIFSNPGATPVRLPIGGANQVLTVVGGVPTWQNSASGFANPMTTQGDLIVAGAAGAATRFPTSIVFGGFLTNNGSGLTPSWGQGPLTTNGDLLIGQSGGTGTRLAIGALGQVLTVGGGGFPVWGAGGGGGGGFANPMTNAGDLILGGAAGTPTRLAIGGTNGQCLQVVNGAVAWAAMNGLPLGGPSGSQPTMFLQPDGTIVVIPLSTYSISGDDSIWINGAFTHLPTIAGGGGSYGGTYNGPWIVGTVKLLPLDYQITSGIVLPNNSGATINLIGHGPGNRMFVGSGATGLKSHVTMGGPQAGFPAQQTMGRIEGLRFDGSNGGLIGIEIGGGWGRHIDVACVNFNSVAGCIGARFASLSSSPSEWMEKCRVNLDLMQNTTACIIENTTNNQNSSSFEYNDISLYIIMTNNATNGPGLLLRNGAYLSGGSLRIRGNFAVNSGPVLSIQGNDGAGTNSAIYHEFVDITVETGAPVAGAPQTVNLGTNNNINNCNGLMTFQFGNWTPASIPAGNLLFGGVVFEQGQTALQTANARPQGWI